MTVRSVHYFKDVIQHKSREHCWIIVNAKVYDVTTFLDDHPGGDEVLLAASGKDASADFEAVGHSDDALDMMKRYCIGEVDRSSLPAATSAAKQKVVGPKARAPNRSFLKMIFQMLIPLLVLGFAFAKYNNHPNPNPMQMN